MRDMAHSDVPSNTQPICRMAHQLPFGTYPFEEHDQLQFEEHDGIDGGTPSTCIGLPHELAHKREIKCVLQMAIEVICWH